MPFTFKQRGTPHASKRVKLAIQSTRSSQSRNVNGAEKQIQRPKPSLPRLKCLDDPFTPDFDLEQMESILTQKRPENNPKSPIEVDETTFQAQNDPKPT
jgi:hypothetical protein